MPDERGRFGEYGGRYVPETLTRALDELSRAYDQARQDDSFQAQLQALLRDYVGRPSPLYHAQRLSEHCGGAQIWLKREDLNHTGSHKINNTLGQTLLTIRMGKTRVIAETGAGQHGVATATACARFGLPCVIYMGEEDIRRQAPNVFSMRLLGAEVRPVTSGSRTLRDAINEAMRDWMASVENTHYILGSVVGPHPFPRIVRDFQSVIGRETMRQCREQLGRLPDLVVACVGGGSNAAGMFYPFVAETDVRLVGVEAGGRGADPGAARRAAELRQSRRSARQLQLRDAGRRRTNVRRPQRVGRTGLSRCRPGTQLLEGRRARGVHQLPRPGSARRLRHAGALRRHSAGARIVARRRPGHATGGRQLADQAIVVCLSGRGDKDAAEIARLREARAQH